ncbi:MAG: hypothetical protein CME60_05140 [Halobacteriovoraceae bacterium]|nr:hypothetical protein [Halobacteriovoraceae bacterium]
MSNKCNLTTTFVATTFLSIYLRAEPVSHKNQGLIEVIGNKEVHSGLVDAPVKVEILSEEYFNEQQYQDLSVAVKDIPGVTTLSSDLRTQAKTPVIQGFGENSVLVMIDGVPVGQNSSFGFDLSQVATSNIERVEVIKGASSSLYGSQAMGGVINIVTKKGSDKTRLELEASASQMTQTSDGRLKNLKGHFEKKLFSYQMKMTYSLREQDQFDLDDQSIIKDGTDFRRQQFGLRIDRNFGKLSTFFDLLYFKGNIESYSSQPLSSNSFGKIQNITETDNLNLKLGTQGKLGKGEFRGIINIEDNDDLLILSDRPDTPFIETKKLTDFKGKRVDIQYRDYELGQHSITTGLLYRESLVDQRTFSQSTPDLIVETSDVENKKVSSYEAFVQDNFWIDSFEISPGARYQYDKDFGSHVAPKINISHFSDYKNFGFKTWASVGTGYRAPSVKERFFTLDHTSLANYIVEGNPDLKPEESLSFQLGQEIKWESSSKQSQMNLYGNLFFNKISNLIEINQGQSDGSQTIFTYENFDKVTSKGIEIGLKGSYQKLNFRLNGSYTETVDRTTDLIIVNRPLYLGMFSLGYKLTDKLSLLSLTRYNGKSYADKENEQISKSFLTTDIKVNYDITQNLTSFLSINNIFNETKDPAQDTVTPQFDGRPNRGTEIFLGFRLRAI